MYCLPYAERSFIIQSFMSHFTLPELIHHMFTCLWHVCRLCVYCSVYVNGFALWGCWYREEAGEFLMTSSGKGGRGRAHRRINPKLGLSIIERGVTNETEALVCPTLHCASVRAKARRSTGQQRTSAMERLHS